MCNLVFQFSLKVCNCFPHKTIRSNTLCSGFLLKPSHGGFGNFFPTGTFAGIGTMCVEFENVMKSTMKKKSLIK